MIEGGDNMRFTIEGFCQKTLLELELDYVDAVILRYFVDFKDSGAMINKKIDDKIYYWVKYEGLIREVPILKLKSRDSVYRRFKKLCEKGVLEHKTLRNCGTYSLFRLGEKYIDLLNYDDNCKSKQECVQKSDINTEYRDINPECSDTNPEWKDTNPYQKINQQNNLSINNSSINNSIYKIVIEYLNKKVGTSYRADSMKTKKYIRARVNEGFTVNDFKKVIDNKSRQWLKTEYEKYLRPKTLFGIKFENYLNQRVFRKKDHFNDYEQRNYDFKKLEKKLLGWE